MMGTYLPQHEDIRFAVIMINRKSIARAPKASLDFISDQEDIVLITQLFYLGHVTSCGEHNACLALNRLNHEGSYVITVLFEFGLQLFIVYQMWDNQC